MTNTWPTPDEIAAKHQRGETLTAWETSVYRLNFRNDGTRYSADPTIRAEQYEADNRTASERFAMAAKRVRQSHGGRPTATMENGKIVFTYPDGTKTGQRVS